MKAAIVSIAIVVTIVAVSACEKGLPMTPLAGAARRGDVAEIDRLIAAGADVNEHAKRKGWPPVIHAIHNGQRAALVRLLDHGASLDAAIGRRALFMASGYGDSKTLRVLLSHGVALPQDAPSAGLLMAAAIGGAWDIDYRWSGCDRHTQVVRILVQRDADFRVVFPLSPTSRARFVSTLRGRIARWQARRRGCDELLRIVGG